MSDRPVTAAIRVDTQNAEHTMISVFVGRNEGARGHAGNLVLRTDELDQLGTRDSEGRLVVAFETLPALNVKQVHI